MQIEYIVQARMPTEKAHGLQIAHMCEAFAELGHTVILTIPRRQNPISEDIFSYYGLRTCFNVRYLWSPDLVSHFGRFGRIVQYVHSALFLVRLLFHTPPHAALIFTRSAEIAWLYKMRGYTVVCEVHDWPESFGSLFAYFLRRVDCIPCNSEGTERACHAHGLMQTMVSHNGIALSEFEKEYDARNVRSELGLPLNARIVMYVGALEYWKGVDTLCAAAPLLAHDVCVVIIGGNVEQVAVLQKKYPTVRFLGTRPYRELAKNQQAADALVVPNIPSNAESTVYTSPIKLFAHMASRKPTIVSDIPSLRAIVSDKDVFFFEAGNVQSLSSVISTVLEDVTEAAVRAAYAFNHVHEYTWIVRGRRILEKVAREKR